MERIKCIQTLPKKNLIGFTSTMSPNFCVKGGIKDQNSIVILLTDKLTVQYKVLDQIVKLLHRALQIEPKPFCIDNK